MYHCNESCCSTGKCKKKKILVTEIDSASVFSSRKSFVPIQDFQINDSKLYFLKIEIFSLPSELINFAMSHSSSEKKACKYFRTFSRPVKKDVFIRPFKTKGFLYKHHLSVYFV